MYHMVHPAASMRVMPTARQGSAHAAPLRDGIVDLWVEPLTRIGVAQGRPEAEARAEARLGVAVTRGLLLDLLATGDREGVDAAMEHYIAAMAPPVGFIPEHPQ